jgi:hypothetical protein
VRIILANGQATSRMREELSCVVRPLQNYRRRDLRHTYPFLTRTTAGRLGVYSKTIGNLSRSAISSGTGVVGQTSTVFHCESPES